MLLFAPGCYAIVGLSWLVQPSLLQSASLFAAIVACFGIWNGIMLPGLPDSDILNALSANALHWLLFLLCGWISLQLAQWIVGIGIATTGLEQTPASSLRGRFSTAKLLGLTIACALLAEGVRRFDLLTLNAPPMTAEMIHWAMFRSTVKEVMLAGALGGVLLGLQWPILFWLRTAGSFRTAGLTLWIALAAVIRWGLAMALARSSFVIPSAQAFRLPNFAEGLQFLLEAIVQTGLVFLGFRLFAMLGLPIRFLRFQHHD